MSANGFAGSVATATTTPAITITTSITGLLKGNGTAISAAAAGGMAVGVPYLVFGLGTSVTVTASGSNSLVSSSTSIRGSLTLPAGVMNSVGRVLRVRFAGYGTTSGTPSTSNFAFLLGGNVVATTGSTNMSANKTGLAFSGQIDLACKTTGASGTSDSGGFVSDVGLVFSTSNARSFANATVSGTPAATTPSPVDWTAALAMDFQISMAASSNSITITNFTVEVV